MYNKSALGRETDKQKDKEAVYFKALELKSK